ncbi:class I SAM-dependent DNA methyltransferase [Cellulomonas sp. McL0617]|uniref:class I SAM-dependent DNA methyltransferase n=1 Tax=Cellulomonas sp. McL0617 TaxID=3415675 RepID=UPI003CEF3D04
MADAIFEDPRLAAVYDAFDGDRADLDAYVAIVEELGARSVLDLGCGTGTFAVMLADRGLDVVGVDPAAASLDVARAKGDQVRWVQGDASTVTERVDLVTMTANVAQVFVTDEEWALVLAAIRRITTYLVFEVRDPDARAWTGWTREHTNERKDLPHVGLVETWCDLVDVSGELVTFRWTNVFHDDGTTLVSDSTLRFRTQARIEESLRVAGFETLEVRDAPDRPGKELVFVARG